MMAHQKNVETGKNLPLWKKCPTELAGCWGPGKPPDQLAVYSDASKEFFTSTTHMSFFADVLVLRSSKARGACQPCGNITRENS